jgi:hypothetical protein
MCCKERVGRMSDRVGALVPALNELERAVVTPGAGLELRIIPTLSNTMVLLAKVDVCTTTPPKCAILVLPQRAHQKCMHAAACRRVSGPSSCLHLRCMLVRSVSIY